MTGLLDCLMDTSQPGPGRIWPRNLANILELVCDSYSAFEFYPLILAPQSLYSRSFIHLIYPHPHPPSSVHTGCIMLVQTGFVCVYTGWFNIDDRLILFHYLVGDPPFIEKIPLSH